MPTIRYGSTTDKTLDGANSGTFRVIRSVDDYLVFDVPDTVPSTIFTADNPPQGAVDSAVWHNRWYFTPSDPPIQILNNGWTIPVVLPQPPEYQQPATNSVKTTYQVYKNTRNTNYRTELIIECVNPTNIQSLECNFNDYPQDRTFVNPPNFCSSCVDDCVEYGCEYRDGLCACPATNFIPTAVPCFEGCSGTNITDYRVVHAKVGLTLVGGGRLFNAGIQETYLVVNNGSTACTGEGLERTIFISYGNTKLRAYTVSTSVRVAWSFNTNTQSFQVRVEGLQDNQYLEATVPYPQQTTIEAFHATVSCLNGANVSLQNDLISDAYRFLNIQTTNYEATHTKNFQPITNILVGSIIVRTSHLARLVTIYSNSESYPLTFVNGEWRRSAHPTTVDGIRIDIDKQLEWYELSWVEQTGQNNPSVTDQWHDIPFCLSDRLRYTATIQNDEWVEAWLVTPNRSYPLTISADRRTASWDNITEFVGDYHFLCVGQQMTHTSVSRFVHPCSGQTAMTRMGTHHGTVRSRHAGKRLGQRKSVDYPELYRESGDTYDS